VGDREEELAVARTPHAVEDEVSCLELGGEAIGGEFGADLGEQVLAAVELDGEVEGTDVHRWGERARSRISIQASSAFPGRHVVEGGRVEVGVELTVEHGEHVAVERGCDPGSVVVGGHDARRVLTRSVPSRRWSRGPWSC